MDIGLERHAAERGPAVVRGGQQAGVQVIALLFFADYLQARAPGLLQAKPHLRRVMDGSRFPQHRNAAHCALIMPCQHRFGRQHLVLHKPVIPFQIRRFGEKNGKNG